MVTPLGYAGLGVLGRAPGVWDPTHVAGLLAWWKADSLALSDGGAVASWTDSSGNGYLAAQATGAKQPTYHTNIQNGRPAVQFNGSTQYLTISPVPAFVGGAYTILAASQSSTTGIVFDTDNSTTTAPFVALYHISTGFARYNHRDSASTELNGGTWNITASNGAWHVHTAQRNGTAFLQQIDATSLTLTTTLGTTTIDQATIGSAGRAAPTLPWNGYIGEILIYNLAPSAGDLATLQAYLKAKWGTS